MKVTIKGVESVDYTSKKTGKPVKGVKFHVERKDPNVVGTCVEPIFINDQTLENIGCVIPAERYKELIDMPAEIEYNRFGMVASMIVNASANASK